MVNYNKQTPYRNPEAHRIHARRPVESVEHPRQTDRQAGGNKVTVTVMHPGPGSPSHGTRDAPQDRTWIMHLSAAVGLGEWRLKHIVLQQAAGQGGRRDAVRGAWLALGLGLGLGLGLLVGLL